MATVAVASPRDSQDVDLQTGRRILVANSSNIVQLASPKRVSSSAQVASPKSPLANRKMVFHPELFKIVKGKGDYTAKLVAVAGFKASKLGAHTCLRTMFSQLELCSVD